jgi:hypothetical protein
LSQTRQRHREALTADNDEMLLGKSSGLEGKAWKAGPQALGWLFFLPAETVPMPSACSAGIFQQHLTITDHLTAHQDDTFGECHITLSFM